MHTRAQLSVFFGALLSLVATPSLALKEIEESGLELLTFRAPQLLLDSDSQEQVPAMSLTDLEQADEDLGSLGLSRGEARLDRRGGGWKALRMREALTPGRNGRNGLRWAQFGRGKPRSRQELGKETSKAFRRFLRLQRRALRLDPNELTAEGKVTVYDGGDLVNIYIPRHYKGIPVWGSYLTAKVAQGDLTLMGTRRWGGIRVSTRPRITADGAMRIVEAYVNPTVRTREWGKTALAIVPTQRRAGRKKARFGQGYRYQLVWVVRPEFEGSSGSYQALVNARSGQLLAFEDRNQYTAEVTGGVYPVANDGIDPDGVEQSGWPMPYMNVGASVTTTGGNYDLEDQQTATFTGPYVRINDNCGSAELDGINGIDWGTSGGTDCVTPGFGGAGNTHSSRTGFYELNKMMEMARGQLPDNAWLQQQLVANTNITANCNAYWNGTVNFYTSGGGCANTGEIAGIFNHEWGHGMDANDATPGIASPSGEGIADIYTALRLNDSCIGRNFLSGNCSGNGDPCLQCSGVRDIDYEKRASGQPHTYSWANANCGGSVHCTGAVYSEAVWSLWKRELQQPPYNYDNNTAHEIVTRLTFIGAGTTGDWFSGGPPYGGCAANSGYMNYLWADDNDANLSNGTPHMRAIFNAFNDQEIACDTPVVQDSGCDDVPEVAPVVVASPGNSSMTLEWGEVEGATNYEVFRTEGVFGCEFGKVKLAQLSGLSHTDVGLQNGRTYSYIVIPKTQAQCFGPASACVSDKPVQEPNFSFECTPENLTVAAGSSANVDCVVDANGGYVSNGAIVIGCSGQPGGVACSADPAAVYLDADNGVQNVTVYLDADPSQSVGDFSIRVDAVDGTYVRAATVDLLVVPEGSNGPQQAQYDAALSTPVCDVAGSTCDSNTLVVGRASLGPEPNQPNTLDTCVDGANGTYKNDESVERITVRTLDGGNFTAGDVVEVSVDVWAWSTGSSDTLDLYYAADALNPVWEYLGSEVPGGGGAQTLTRQFTLSDGPLQAVRANFRYQGSLSACSTGSYDDSDDVAFGVESAGPPEPQPSIDSFGASPDTVLVGGTTTLSWSTSNALSCTPTGGGSTNWTDTVVEPNGSGTQSIQVPVSVDSVVFGLTCSGANCSVSKHVTVTVVLPVSITSFEAFPNAVAAGQSTTLTWTTSGAASCEPAGGPAAWQTLSIGNSSGGTAIELSDPGVVSFELQCIGATGDTAIATAGPVTVTAPPPSIDAFSAAPTTVREAGFTTLSWTTSNAVGCTPTYGGSTNWTDTTIEPNGSGTQSIQVPASVGPVVFGLTCDGVEPISASAQTTIMVVKPVVITSFAVVPDSVIAGETTTLTWATSGAVSCESASGPAAWQTLSVGISSGGTAIELSDPGTVSFGLQCTGEAADDIASAIAGPVTVTAPPSSIDLTVTLNRKETKARLRWTGADTRRVRVLRGNVQIKRTLNDGAWNDQNYLNGVGAYQVCNDDYQSPDTGCSAPESP